MRFLHARVHLPLALAIIAAISSAFAGMIAYRSVQALGINQGGRGSQVKICVLDTPETDPILCSQSCPICTTIWGTECANHNEVFFQPAGGMGNYACPMKAERWLGGGTFPRIGSWLMLKAQYLGGRLIQPGLGR